MMMPGTNPRSPAPWDLPYWMPDYMIFFGALYLVLTVLGIGLALVMYKTYKDSKKTDDNKMDTHHH